MRLGAQFYFDIALCRAFLPMVIRTGMPIKSASLNFTPHARRGHRIKPQFPCFSVRYKYFRLLDDFSVVLIDGVIMTSNGAILIGKIMPLSSLPASMAEAMMRFMPMP